MIYTFGSRDPTPAQRRVLRKIADSSFERRLPEDFGPVPCDPEWVPDMSTGIALRARYVEPHRDGWVGSGDVPPRYVAVFWVVDMPSHAHLILQVGDSEHCMEPGDYAVFDDSVLHSVFSPFTWRGCAYQAVPADFKE